MGVRGDYSLSSPHSGASGSSVRPAVRPGPRPRTRPSGGACAAGTPARRAARSSFRTPLATPAPGGASFRTPPPNPRLLAKTIRSAPALLGLCPYRRFDRSKEENAFVSVLFLASCNSEKSPSQAVQNSRPPFRQRVSITLQKTGLSQSSVTCLSEALKQGASVAG